MAASETALRAANRPPLRTLPHRRNPATVYEAVPVTSRTDDDRLLTLILGLAPMAFVFFYLAFLALFMF